MLGQTTVLSGAGPTYQFMNLISKIYPVRLEMSKPKFTEMKYFRSPTNSFVVFYSEFH